MSALQMCRDTILVPLKDALESQKLVHFDPILSIIFMLICTKFIKTYHSGQLKNHGLAQFSDPRAILK